MVVRLCASARHQRIDERNFSNYASAHPNFALPRRLLGLFNLAPDDIDMVITDQTMPGITGTELAKAMLARRPELPIVLSTGFSNSLDDDVARRIGIRRVLYKPVPAKVIGDIVTQYLEKPPAEA